MGTKEFYNPNTGRVVEYPEHFAEIKPYLIPVEEMDFEIDPCEDCHSDVPEDETEPEPSENDESMLD